MTVMDQATPIDGWQMAKDECPSVGTELEVLHFGNWDDPIPDTATVDQWGICPHGDNGHGKRSTVTHWRMK